jgi:hypothetical protein
MKKFYTFHMAESVKTTLIAVGFLAFIMAVTYIYWYA